MTPVVVGLDGKTYRPIADRPRPEVTILDVRGQLLDFIAWARKTKRILNDGVSLTAAGVDFLIDDESQQTWNGVIDDLTETLAIVKANLNAGSFDEQLGNLLDGGGSA